MGNTQDNALLEEKMALECDLNEEETSELTKKFCIKQCVVKTFE